MSNPDFMLDGRIKLRFATDGERKIRIELEFDTESDARIAAEAIKIQLQRGELKIGFGPTEVQGNA